MRCGPSRVRADAGYGDGTGECAADTRGYGCCDARPGWPGTTKTGAAGTGAFRADRPAAAAAHRRPDAEAPPDESAVRGAAPGADRAGTWAAERDPPGVAARRRGQSDARRGA